MKINSYSKQDLLNAFLSMAKIGKSKEINYSDPITPTAALPGKPLDSIKIPFLAPLKEVDAIIQWNYVGDNYPPSKFQIQVFMEAGPAIICSFTLINNKNLFKVNSLQFAYNGVNFSFSNLEKFTSFDTLIDFLKEPDLHKIIDKIKEHYQLNEAQELKLKQ